MRRSVLAGLALVALAAAATPATQGWVVVQRDGTRVVLAEKPERRSGKLVGRLLGPGTLVSVPAARVDEEATRRANEEGRAGPAPAAPAARPTPRPFETPPLGDRAALKTSGEEASRVLSAARTAAPGTDLPAEAGAETERQGESRPSGAEPTDREGRGEAWWRDRAAAVRGRYEDAGRDLAEAEARLEAAERAHLGVGRAERNTFVIRVNEERAAAERARAEHRSASAAWESLQEDARKSGAFPGWLR